MLLAVCRHMRDSNRRVGQLVVMGALLVVACSGSTTNQVGSAGAAGAPTSAGAAGASTSGGAADTSSGGVSGTASGGVSGAASGGVSNTASGGASVSAAGATSAAGAPSGPVLIDLLSEAGGCLARALPVDTNTASPTFGQVTCQIVEASAAAACNCGKPGRAAVSLGVATGVRQQLMGAGDCGASGQPDCTSFCLCEILQEVGAPETKCQADPVAAATDPTVPPGFCYDDDPTSLAVASCPTGEQRTLLFVSPGANPTPAPGSQVFLACPLG